MSLMNSPAPPPRPLADLSTELRLACLRIARRNRFESDSTVAPHQVAVLVRIDDGLTSASDIAAEDRVSAATVSRTIAGLVDEGWVTRRANEGDGRRIDLALTDSGRQALTDTRLAREEWMLSRLGQLSADEVQRLTRAVDVLAKVATL